MAKLASVAFNVVISSESGDATVRCAVGRAVDAGDEISSCVTDLCARFSEDASRMDGADNATFSCGAIHEVRASGGAGRNVASNDPVPSRGTVDGSRASGEAACDIGAGDEIASGDTVH